MQEYWVDFKSIKVKAGNEAQAKEKALIQMKFQLIEIEDIEEAK